MFAAETEANRQNILHGDKCRITMLTEGLVRLEYSEDGIFEDRATQTVINRDFRPVEFQVKETEEELEILTWRFRLNYNKKEFNPRGLKAQVLGNTGFWNNVWHYGDELRDLKGTARTLDTVDGASELGHGLVSTEGFPYWMILVHLFEERWVAPTPQKRNSGYLFLGLRAGLSGMSEGFLLSLR